MGGGSGGARPADGAVREGGGSTGAVPTSLRIPQPRRGCRRPPGPERRDAGGRRPRSAVPPPPPEPPSGSWSEYRSRAGIPAPGRSPHRPRRLRPQYRGGGELGAWAGARDPLTGAGEARSAGSRSSYRELVHPRCRGWGVRTWGLISPCSWAFSTPKPEARIPLILGIQDSNTRGLYPPMLRLGTPKPGVGLASPSFLGL